MGELGVDWRRQSAERSEQMVAIVEVCRKWNIGRISTPTAIEKIREVLEPVIVRVGGQTHTPEVQS
jgi:hypothetical protein